MQRMYKPRTDSTAKMRRVRRSQRYGRNCSACRGLFHMAERSTCERRAGHGQVCQSYRAAGGSRRQREQEVKVRLGGIYALERIANQSERDYWPIMEVLTAYVRENTPYKPQESIDYSQGGGVAAPVTAAPVTAAPVTRPLPIDIRPYSRSSADEIANTSRKVSF